jgi:hypothetical protein
MNRWKITILQAATEPSPVKMAPSTRPAGNSGIARLAQVESRKQTERLSIFSIAKAQAAWRIFEVKYAQYILFERISTDAADSTYTKMTSVDARRAKIAIALRSRTPNSIANLGHSA